jgi:hypothetical protein
MSDTTYDFPTKFIKRVSSSDRQPESSGAIDDLFELAIEIDRALAAGLTTISKDALREMAHRIHTNACTLRFHAETENFVFRSLVRRGHLKLAPRESTT